jgi:hypothetical protein
MINYTERLTILMRDIVARVPTLSFIDMNEILVFARFGRADADGAFATCHSLNLPVSEPGHYFWRDPVTGRTTKRSEWFVMKSPRVEVEGRRISYLISFSLPRFCEQTLARSRKADLYPAHEPWVAKLDTVVHELYHVNPHETGIRRVERSDGSPSRQAHSPAFFETVARMVRAYLATRPDPRVYQFLQDDFAQLIARHGILAGTTFRSYPSFPQRYIEPMAKQPRTEDGVKIEPIRPLRRAIHYSERDLALRVFRRTSCQPAGRGTAAA